MTRILLIAAFVVFFVSRSFVWCCSVKPQDLTYFNILNCDSEPFKKTKWFSLIFVVHIDASYKKNNFPTIDSHMFQNMTYLKQLWLALCEIEVIEEDAFSDLTSLLGLNLNNNKITQLDENAFSNNQNLLEIDLAFNQINEIPSGLLHPLTELEVFNGKFNQLEVIHPNTFQQNKKLKWLYLAANKIVAIAGGSFSGLTKLAYLNLRGNTCIDKEYGNWKSEVPIDLYSIDLANCAKNYSSNLMVIITVASTLIIIGAIAVVIYICKAKNVAKREAESQEMKMQEMGGSHYYSTPDTPKQSKQERELKQKLEDPYEEVNYYSTPALQTGHM
jgi:hypothetical protein